MNVRMKKVVYLKKNSNSDFQSFENEEFRNSKLEISKHKIRNSKMKRKTEGEILPIGTPNIIKSNAISIANFMLNCTSTPTDLT